MILGVDVRDDAIAAVVVDGRGTVVGRATAPGTGPDAVTLAVRTAAAGSELSGVGIAVGASADTADTAVAAVTAAAAEGAVALPPPRRLGRGCAMALGESWTGAARGSRNVVALTVSETVSAGIVVGGRPFEGAHGHAGVAGWLALNPVEREDYRRRGCLEAEIGSGGIVRRLVWRIKSGDTSSALELAGGDMGAITVTHVFSAARAGDGVSISVVRDTARYIGMAVANLVAIVDPEVVVLGGLIADAADQLLDLSRAEALRHLPAATSSSLTVVAAALGADAAPLGAARAAMFAR